MRLIDADEIRIKPEYMHDICGVAMIRVEDIARILNDMPTIQSEPERKKGKWEPMFNGEFKGGAYWFSCSKCKRIVPEVRNGGWDFCPNCGARMVQEGEDNDS